MRLLTERLKNKAWDALMGALSHLNGFESREAFEAAFAELEGVKGDGSGTYVCRRRVTRAFDSANMILVNVEDDADFERVTTPSIGGKPL